MGKKSKRVKQAGQETEWQAIIRQARQKWLGKRVLLSQEAGYGVVYGKVTSVSNGGDVVVEPLPNQPGRFVAAFMSVGYVDRMLTIVD